MSLMDSLMKAGGPAMMQGVQQAQTVITRLNENTVTLNNNILAVVNRQDTTNGNVDQILVHLVSLSQRFEQLTAAVEIILGRQLESHPNGSLDDHDRRADPAHNGSLDDHDRRADPVAAADHGPGR